LKEEKMRHLDEPSRLARMEEDRVKERVRAEEANEALAKASKGKGRKTTNMDKAVNTSEKAVKDAEKERAKAEKKANADVARQEAKMQRDMTRAAKKTRG
jgi:hypothetical protein